MSSIRKEVTCVDIAVVRIICEFGRKDLSQREIAYVAELFDHLARQSRFAQSEKEFYSLLDSFLINTQMSMDGLDRVRAVLNKRKRTIRADVERGRKTTRNESPDHVTSTTNSVMSRLIKRFHGTGI